MAVGVGRDRRRGRVRVSEAAVILSLDGVVKSFKRTRVLDGVTLQISAGESVALLGANGSGKTTTLRCAVGLARADAGAITIGGIDLQRDSVRARSRVSYLPQKSVFPPTLTVREALAAVARLRGIAPAAIDAELEWCGLAVKAGRSVGHLSGGERQRLAMAIAFLPRVDLYLFDEPSANLDPAASRMLFQRARQLKRDGHTLLFTTHSPADVTHLASRIVLLRVGRIDSQASGECELLRYERLLERDMWGDDHEDDASSHDGAAAPADRDGMCDERRVAAARAAGSR
jgi:ABC-type multidrug transport system ATPase subunit